MARCNGEERSGTILQEEEEREEGKEREKGEKRKERKEKEEVTLTILNNSSQ